jgi:RNA polymerase sigma-70 factor (ECF subfamily)
LPPPAVATPREPPSPELLARFAKGDPKAISALYREHAGLLARVCSRMGAGSPADVEDVVQTTFLEAIRGAHRFEGKSSFRGWLVAIALNQTRLHRRSEGRARRKLEQIAHVQPAHEDRELVHVRAEEMRRVEAALAGLPELQREALVLSEIEGLPAKEIAELLGAPAATIWRRVHDARKSLRRLLGEEKK